MARKTTDPIDILLEMGIDLDNLSEEEDYLSALMEAASTIEFQTKGSGDDRSAVLRKEILKVRKKRFAEARPEAKKTKINPSTFFDNKPSKEVSLGQKALPTSALVKTSSVEDYKTSEELDPQEETKKKTRKKVSDPLKDILKGINAIIKTLNQQQKFSKKQAEKDRKSTEKKKREQSEKDLEKSGLKKFISGAGKILKPVKGLLDGIFEFISKVLIGNLLVKIIEWMGNDDNRKKLDAIGEFFKATWPALLAAFVAFRLGLGGFITNLIGLVGKFLPKLLGLIPKMIKGLGTLAMGNPLATAAVAVTAGTAIAAVMANQEGTAVIEDPEDPDKSQADEIRQFGGMTSSPMSADMFGYNKGGMVPGSGPNKDTVPAMLAPGEFVMSRGAVQKYGTDTFASMNAAGGGNNLPKRMNGITYAAGGGLMGKPAEGKSERQSSQVQKEMEERGNRSTPTGNFFSGIGKALGFGSKKEEDKKIGTFDESSLKKAMDAAGYTNPIERAMFLAQMAHESGNFKFDEEIHDGSNYEGRSDLGNIKPGDGRRYKGRGYIQLTGRANYKHYGDKLGVDLENNPQLAKRPDIAAAVAVLYWNERVDRNAARSGDVRKVTYNINGGYNGLADRESKFRKYVGDPNYSAPGGGLIASSGSGGRSVSSSAISMSGKGGIDMFLESDLFKKSSSKGSSIEPMPSRPSKTQTIMSEGQKPSANSSAAMIANQNNFPDIDANAMWSQDKIKTLGITVA